MHNQGTLLICPACQVNEFNTYGTYRSFGSITNQGEVIIMRKSNHRTMFIAKEFTLVCDCGYSIYYNHGKISVGELPTSSLYETKSSY